MTDQRGESLNILLSAYACTPNAGSEPGVGFETLRAIALDHNVWVMTRRKNIEPLETYFRLHPTKGTVHIAGLDLSSTAKRLKKSFGPLGMQWYYDRWQELARSRMEELSERVHFDLVHHITFASDWAKAGVAGSDVPFVWGPIGGGVNAPTRLVGTLGVAGVVNEISRTVGRALMRRRRWYRAAWRSAAVVLVQNNETASLAHDEAEVMILPNSTALLTDPPVSQGRRNREILVVGRLIPWKGGSLALRAFHLLSHGDISLHFLGVGPDKHRLQKEAVRLQLAERVHFEGGLPREVVLERISRAAALLHPGLHDESPVAVGEALSLGTPVVCLDHGGPPELLRRWPDGPAEAVRATNLKETTRNLADALDRLMSQNHPVLTESLRPSPSFAEGIAEAYALTARRAQASDGDPGFIEG